jgi:phage shock protein C
MQTKKLYRSSTDKMITGVCGGLGEYLDIDSTVLRLLSALVIVFSGVFPGVLVYILAALIMPLQPTASVTETPKPVTPAEEVKA